ADSDELASLYRAQLLHVTDQVRRLVATEDEAGGGGGGGEHSGGRAVAGGALTTFVDDTAGRTDWRLE
ncbi:MAG: hypothetical protein VXW43_16080, partial [Pseudomonadota bacterium]|nr:hypothetical protein [Pseudomonadota bacterium]